MLIWPLLRRTTGGPWVDASMATQLINREDALVVDVRDPGEYGAGHILGAKNWPLDHIDERGGEAVKRKDKPVIVYCDTGDRTPKAAAALRKLGFTRVVNLSGGLSAAATISTPSNARAGSTHSSRARHERSAAAASKFSNRKDLRQGHLAGDSQCAAGVRAEGAAAGRSADQHRVVAIRRRLFRGDGVGDRDRARRGAHPLSRRGGTGGHLLGAQRAERRPRRAARRGMPDDPVPVPARDHLGPDRARRLPAGAAQPDFVRGALRAAPAAAAATAGRRGTAHRGRALMRLLLLPILFFVTFTATAGDFRAVEGSGAGLFDSPSREAMPGFVVSRDYPLVVLVQSDARAQEGAAPRPPTLLKQRPL